MAMAALVGSTPKIDSAWELVPVGTQPRLQLLPLATGRTVDLLTEDLGQVLVAERDRVRRDPSLSELLGPLIEAARGFSEATGWPESELPDWAGRPVVRRLTITTATQLRRLRQAFPQADVRPLDHYLRAEGETSVAYALDESRHPDRWLDLDWRRPDGKPVRLVTGFGGARRDELTVRTVAEYLADWHTGGGLELSEPIGDQGRWIGLERGLRRPVPVHSGPELATLVGREGDALAAGDVDPDVSDADAIAICGRVGAGASDPCALSDSGDAPPRSPRVASRGRSERGRNRPRAAAPAESVVATDGRPGNHAVDEALDRLSRVPGLPPAVLGRAQLRADQQLGQAIENLLGLNGSAPADLATAVGDLRGTRKANSIAVLTRRILALADRASRESQSGLPAARVRPTSSWHRGRLRQLRDLPLRRYLWAVPVRRDCPMVWYGAIPEVCECGEELFA
jgi:hypothetical protein